MQQLQLQNPDKKSIKLQQKKNRKRIYNKAFIYLNIGSSGKSLIC